MQAEIFLSSINDVKKFVNIVNLFDFEIDMISGRYTVDAKSIMGIFSLDLTKPITVVTEKEEDGKLLLEKLQGFIVE